MSDTQAVVDLFIKNHNVKVWDPKYTDFIKQYKHYPRSILIKLLKECYPEYPFKKSASYMYINKVLNNE